MDELTDFVIPIVGLKFGEHSYKFKVNRQFFKKFDNTDIQEGSLQVDLILKKRSNHILIIFVEEYPSKKDNSFTSPPLLTTVSYSGSFVML